MDRIVARQRRRKVTLELLSLVVPVAAAVVLSGVWIAGWSIGASVVVCIASSLPLALGWVWHRNKVPATIAPYRSPSEEEDDSSDADGSWGLLDAVLAAVVVAGVTLFGLLVLFWLPLMVVVLFGVAHSESVLGPVLGVGLITLGVAFVLEMAVVWPLARAWDLALHDDEPAAPDSTASDPAAEGV